MPPRQRSTGRPSGRDQTGSTDARLKRENAAEIQATSERTTMAMGAPPPPVIADPSRITDLGPDGIMRETVMGPDEIYEAAQMGYDDVLPDAAVDLPDGTQPVEVKQVRTEGPEHKNSGHGFQQGGGVPQSPEVANQGNRGDAGPREVVEPTKVPMRVTEDIEHCTIGKNLPDLNFKTGVWYRVPPHVYHHLDEIGLVYH